MNLTAFDVAVRRWFETSFTVRVGERDAKRKGKSKRMNLAKLLTAIPARRRRRGRPHGSFTRHSGCVYLEFVNARARSVCVAGSFNDWRPAATPMIDMGRGWWVKGLVLPPGRYEYRLVVDGQWVPDPYATETASTPDGAVNSVLRVPSEAVVERPRRTQPDSRGKGKNQFPLRNQNPINPREPFGEGSSTLKKDENAITAPEGTLSLL